MDVTKQNFDDVLPQILKDIKSSSFIAIDTEFTGLLTDDSFKRSYFDTENALYEKESKNLQEVSICQIGLSIFKGVIDSNKYLIKTYNVYVRPHSILSVDENILWQVSSLEFLKKCNFSFEKWLEEGVPCLNHEQEKELKNYYTQSLLGESGNLMPFEVLDEIERVKLWKKKANLGDSLDVTFKDDSQALLFLSSLKASMIKARASYARDCKLTKIMITATESFDENAIEEESRRALEEVTARHRGFVSIFDSLIGVEVPLVFHNGLLDLMLMYKQFHGSLPKKFSEFQKKLHELFPLVYDTKQLAFILGIKLRISQRKGVVKVPENFLSETSLMKVKKDLESNFVVLHRPTVEHSQTTPKYSGAVLPHEAGYDAFSTGYCFLQLSHIYAMQQYEKAEYHRPLSPRELVSAMKQWRNEIPVQRIGVNYLSLDGERMKPLKVFWLVVEPRKPFRFITPEAVAPSFATFGHVDVMARNKRSVFLASPKRSVTQNILKTFANDESFVVTKYNPVRHSPLIRSLAW